MSEFELPPWSEYHEARIEEEEELRHDRAERAAEIMGCDPECRKRWYDDLPLAQKIEIQKQNIAVAKLLGYGASVSHFQTKLIALMEELANDQHGASQAGTG